MTPKEEIDLLRDALDHIARIANASRQQTKRLDWISSRAREALRGVPWNREYLLEPKKASMEEVHDLRGTLFMLVRACETENLTAIATAVEEARANHPSLFRRRDDTSPRTLEAAAISQPKKIRARPRFVGYSLLIFAIPLALTTLWLLKKHDITQAVSLALLSIPLCYFVIKCLSTKEPDAVDLINLRHARAIYLFCLIASIALWILEGLSYAIPGLIAALLFCTREPIIIKLARGGAF